jgi:hypothetical protein
LCTSYKKVVGVFCAFSCAASVALSDASFQINDLVYWNQPQPAMKLVLFEKISHCF